MPRRSRSTLTAAVAVSLIGMGVLSGCAGGASDAERAAQVTWAEDLVAASSDGGAQGAMSADSSADGVPLDFAEPVKFSAVELRCTGTDSARFTVHYTGTDDAVTVTQDIVCQDGGLRTPIAIPLSVGELTALSATVTSPDGEGRWVVIPQR